MCPSGALLILTGEAAAIMVEAGILVLMDLVCSSQGEGVGYVTGLQGGSEHKTVLPRELLLKVLHKAKGLIRPLGAL